MKKDRVNISNKIPLPNKEELEFFYRNNCINDVLSHFDICEKTFLKWREHFNIQPNYLSLPEVFTQQQYELIMASMLGDACISKRYNNHNCRFGEKHSVKQLGYLEYKYEILKPFSCDLEETYSNTINYERINGVKTYTINYEEIRQDFKLTTHACSLLTALERKWYKRDEFGNYVYRILKNGTEQRIKVLPEDLYLNPFIVAIWYFDDGHCKWKNIAPSHCKRKNRTRKVELYTNCFTVDECHRLTDMLKNLGITHCKVDKNNAINVLSKSFVDFIDMVKPYCPHECMTYKVDYIPSKRILANDLKYSKSLANKQVLNCL